MTAVIKRVRSFKGAVKLLESLALRSDNRFFFRGHKESSWRLDTTYSRYKGAHPYDTMSDFGEMIQHFEHLVETTGQQLPYKQNSNRSSLEFARHHGLPTPALDWTFSPYVALFFAFNGVRTSKAKSAVIYALRLEGLADLWTRHISGTGLPPPNYADFYNKFFDGPDLSDGFPDNELCWIQEPSVWNVRMTRQMGSFLYDTIDYSTLGVKDLEEFITNNRETPTCSGPSDPTLYKIYIPYSAVQEVFDRLDIMAINGTRLYANHEGAVADAINAYVYNRKSGYFWKPQRQ